jgi:hypothetical protein
MVFSGFYKKMFLRKLFILLILLNTFSFCISAEDNSDTTYNELKNIELITYPVNDSMIELRKQCLHVIQGDAKSLMALVFFKYLRTSNPKKTEALEELLPILDYLKNVTNRAIDSIAATKVESGLICWYFYNMGYVFQTATSTIGIDLSFRNAEKLAPFLDALLITHWHHDHFNKRLVDQMLLLKKPVCTNFYPNSTIIKKDTTITIGHNEISMCLGDHHRYVPVIISNNMIHYQISYKWNNEKFTIYHTGDGNNIKKMKTNDSVDIFIVHTQLPMPLSKAVYHVKPKITFASHILELGHPLPLRWNYDYCNKEISKVDGFKVITLGWGERWCSEKTIISLKQNTTPQ